MKLQTRVVFSNLTRRGQASAPELETKWALVGFNKHIDYNCIPLANILLRHLRDSGAWNFP